MCAAALALVFAGATVIQGRQWESDLALFSNAHERAPHNPLPLDYMARTLYGLGRTDEAIDRYHDLLRVDPGYWNGNYILGLANYQLGRYDEAEKYLIIATQVWPREFVRPEPAQFYYLGLLQMRKSDYQAAEVSLRRAIELRPEAPGYRHALATLLQQSGRVAEAKEQLRLDAENHRAVAEREKDFEK
jgi:tetratricopeptide (TPR) repeat protein